MCIDGSEPPISRTYTRRVSIENGLHLECTGEEILELQHLYGLPLYTDEDILELQHVYEVLGD